MTTYGAQIRHPGSVLDPPRDKERGLSKLSWILLGVAVFVILAWRYGWFGKFAGPGVKAVSGVRPVANPHGWM
jgi:hypothetical protein